MILYATTHRVGDALTTDDIIAPAWRASDDPAALAAHCLAGKAPAVAEHAREGDLLLAGRDFGAGADQDVAALALQAAGFAAIVCCSADTGFVAAAADFGLPVLVCPAAVAAVAEGVVVRIDLQRGRIEDRTSGAVYDAQPCAPELIAAVRRTQMLARMRRVVEEEGFDG
jgi:3-isopropylmalate/(R)-2-methylmalate dehydratase small subunit